jgi:XTP/dITP diphosphohydrolase
MTVFWATGNPGKLREFRLAVPPGIALEALPGLSSLPAPEETGATFEANAILKANYYSNHAPAGALVFADDSGLEVDALGGEPGVRSARYAGEHATDADNNALLLERLHALHAKESRLTARFVCVIALSRGGHPLQTFRGTVEGDILNQPRGANGFGYDPLFFCPALGCTLAEADDHQKFNVSHRGAALRDLFRFLAAMPEPR